MPDEIKENNQDGMNSETDQEIDLDQELEKQLSEEGSDDAPDPFQRLKKKKVARPRTLSSSTETTKVTSKVKRWAKISPRIFLLWCAFFFIVFVGIMYAWLYYAITSSEILQSIGLEVDTVKNILIIFAVLFFGLIFFAGFYLLVLNIYRLVTSKWRKVWYVVWLVLWFFVIVIAIIAWTISIQRIRSISWSQRIVTDQIIMPYVVTRDAAQGIWINEGIPLIAPMKMRFRLNKDQFDRNILRSIGPSNQILWFALDCGNGQTITAWPQIHLGQWSSYFQDYCLFLEKGDYFMTLSVTYSDRATWNTNTQDFEVWGLRVKAAIEILPTEWDTSLNDDRDELIIGVAPVTVDIKAQLLFTDLWLSEDRILWDLNGDGGVDLENNAAFEYPFGDSKLHTISYQLPNYPRYANTRFTFDVRVVESELARCTLDVETVDNDRRYRFTPKFDEQIQVASYSYTVYDTNRETIVETFQDTKWAVSYTFPEWWNYEIQVAYFTPEDEKWRCSSTPLTVWFVGNQVEFDLKYRQDDTTPFVSVWESTPVVISHVERVINVNLLPATLELTILDINPDPNATVKLYYDGRQIFSERSDVYEVDIGTLGQKELKFTITTAQWKTDEQLYEVNVSRQPVKAMIQVEPDVGEDPLEVTLDASISPLYNEEDEIVYFTRDFGDGEIRNNISQWKVTHMYRYDEEKETGEYYPKVTVKTKLWYEDSYRLETPIVVKKQQREVRIRVDSHPTQQARVWDKVVFSVETDGLVEHIDWNFWNFEVLGCDWRTCVQAPVYYDEPGEYTVRVEVQYENDVPVVGRIKIRVYE